MGRKEGGCGSDRNEKGREKGKRGKGEGAPVSAYLRVVFLDINYRVQDDIHAHTRLLSLSWKELGTKSGS